MATAAAAVALLPWGHHRLPQPTFSSSSFSFSFSPSIIHGKKSRHHHHQPPESVTQEVSYNYQHVDRNPSSRSVKPFMQEEEVEEDEAEEETSSRGRHDGNGRVFFLDVNPICYDGSTPSLHNFAHWLSLFFSEVAFRRPVIAVLDGEGGCEYRRRLLPSYKSHRRRRTTPSMDLCGGGSQKELLVMDVLQKCHVPVVKIKGYEADDVIATLMDQVLKRGFRAVIGSPDKDFKQLICEDVQMVMPIPEMGRWSFYTLKHYMAQYNCSPGSDLSLRSMLGDESDGVPGIRHLVPGFGRKTALKLLKRHASLENMLRAASIRTVGKAYVQDALTLHADYLRRNYEVLSLRRDLEIHLEDSWLIERDSDCDFSLLSDFVRRLDLEQSPRERSL